MIDQFWFAFFQFATSACITIIGYLSLKHKASAANVARLEAQVDHMQERLNLLDKDHQLCQEERRRLINEAVTLAEEAARLKLQLAAKEAAAVVQLRADVVATRQEIKENTAITKVIAEAVKDKI